MGISLNQSKKHTTIYGSVEIGIKWVNQDKNTNTWCAFIWIKLSYTKTQQIAHSKLKIKWVSADKNTNNWWAILCAKSTNTKPTTHSSVEIND